MIRVGVAILVVVAAVGAAACGAGSPAQGSGLALTSARHPRLALSGIKPLVVRGTGFHARERVRVVVHQPSGRVTRHAVAAAGGTFSATFAGVAPNRCGGFSVSATGSAGSRARLVRRALPECPPA